MKAKLLSITVALVLSISTFSQTTVCFSSPDGIDNTWTGGWSYKEYIIPYGYKIDSVNMGATRPGYQTSQEDFIFSVCAGTTTYDVNTSTSPFNYSTDNNSEYNHWIDLTSFNYSSIGVVRIFLPVNAGAIWNNLCLAVSPVCSLDLTAGLVAKFDFNGNTNDGSSNTNNATVNGATLTTDRFGNANSAYSFNGTSDYIEIPHSNAYNNQLYTISFWTKFSTAATPGSGGFNVNPALISKLSPSTSVTYNNWVFYEGNGTPGFAYGSAGYGGTPSLFNNDSWHNIVCTVNTDSVRFYYDGTLTSVVAKGPNLTFNSQPIRIGRSLATYWKAFNGAIDDLRIYDRALTTCDIDSLYSMANPCTGVTASISPNSSVTFCLGDNVLLTASTATSYLWSNNATTQSITVSAAGAYTVATVNSDGCSATSQATTVTLNPKPTVITNAPSAICSPSTIDLTLPAITAGSTGGLTYTYFSDAGATTPYLTPSAASTGTYYIVGATSSSCFDTTAVSVAVNPLPTVSINAIQNFTNINASPISLAGTPTGGTFSGNGVSGNTFSPINAGLGTSHITYNYTDNNTCANSAVTSTIVYDTTGMLCTSYDTVYTSVADTLVINAMLTGVNPPNNVNPITIYPNPASTHITIDNGNYNLMSGYTVKIVNKLGQTVFTSLINQQQFYIDLSSWSGNGIYFLHVIDAQNSTIEIKKIILQ